MKSGHSMSWGFPSLEKFEKKSQVMDYPKHEYPFSAVDLGPRKGNVERKRQKTKVKKRNTEILSRGLCSLVWKQQGLPCPFLRGEAVHGERRAEDDGGETAMPLGSLYPTTSWSWAKSPNFCPFRL